MSKRTVEMEAPARAVLTLVLLGIGGAGCSNGSTSLGPLQTNKPCVSNGTRVDPVSSASSAKKGASVDEKLLNRYILCSDSSGSMFAMSTNDCFGRNFNLVQQIKQDQSKASILLNQIVSCPVTGDSISWARQCNIQNDSLVMQMKQSLGQSTASSASATAVNCPNQSIAQNALAGTAGQFAATAATTRDSLNSADQLLSNSHPLSKADGSANTKGLAATAGNGSFAPGNGGGAGLVIPPLPTAGGALSSGSGGGSVGSSVGGTVSTSGTDALRVPTAEKDSLNPAVAGATYGGGRGGRGDSGAGANPFSFGNSDAGAAQAGGELGFAGKVVNANGTGDPENYFSLIGRDESLFKKVNARYVQKSFSWIREDLGREGAARSLSGKFQERCRIYFKRPDFLTFRYLFFSPSLG